MTYNLYLLNYTWHERSLRPYDETVWPVSREAEAACLKQTRIFPFDVTTNFCLCLNNFSNRFVAPSV
jgi:hypothetical protein